VTGAKPDDDGRIRRVNLTRMNIEHYTMKRTYLDTKGRGA